MLANNIANASTEGYKGDREFYGLYLSSESDGGTQPIIEKPWTDFSQGMLRTTGNPLDVAIQGKGFFAVNGPSGPLYTRNGSFTVSPAGLLTAGDGYPVRGVDGGTITLVEGRRVDITSDGTVMQDGQPAGQIAVVDFPNPESLSKQGANYFTADPKAQSVPAAGAQVHQGKLESSNAAPAEAAVRLIAVMRQFEMLQKAVSLGAEMNRKAIEEVARPGS